MKRLASLVACVAALAACNMNKFTTDQTAKVLKVASTAMNMDSDPEFMREAIPASLKTVEGFWVVSPDNKDLIRILARGYCEYGFGFLQDAQEIAEMQGHQDEADHYGERAAGMFMRCHNYGLKLLGEKWEDYLQNDSTDEFAKRLKKVGKGKVEGLYWTALGLASATDATKDITLVAYVPKIKLMFERCVELNPNFYYGGAHLALAMLSLAVPAALGGDPENGKAHFEEAIKIGGDRYFMPRVLYAYKYGTAAPVIEKPAGTLTAEQQAEFDKQDAEARAAKRKFFHDTLVEVLKTPPSVWPENRLANELAQLRAKRYLEHEKELFNVAD